MSLPTKTEGKDEPVRLYLQLFVGGFICIYLRIVVSNTYCVVFFVLFVFVLCAQFLLIAPSVLSHDYCKECRIIILILILYKWGILSYVYDNKT
jgi:hypothetical protein